MSGKFVSEVKATRKRARKHIDQETVTPGYQRNLEAVLRLLEDALTTEIVCLLRYTRPYDPGKGIHSKDVAAEFLEHAGEEQGHADEIAARIVQLRGAADLEKKEVKTAIGPARAKQGRKGMRLKH